MDVIDQVRIWVYTIDFINECCVVKDDEKTSRTETHIYVDTGIYSLGEPADITQYSWYHGKMSKEEAEIAIGKEFLNNFLVRQSSNDLFLTSKRGGWIHHHLINYSTEGYCLEGKEKMFKTIPEMILHYLTFPIVTGSNQILGIGCDREGKTYH